MGAENTEGRIRVGVIGAGAISGIYLTNMIQHFPQLDVRAVSAGHIEHAQVKAAQFHIDACTTEELLRREDIDMVVVLTPVGTHYDLIRQALLAGKHVYTEKTLTDDPAKAAELLKLADERKLYLGSAPDTFLGPAWQTARKAIDDGMLGEIHSFAISGNRCNDILLSMFSFLRQPGAGILYDYAVYYMTALVSLLGPVARVAAVTGRPYPTHRNILPESPDFGKMMDTPNESQVSALLRLRSGVTGTLHIDADSAAQDQAYFTICGTKGILYLTDPNGFCGEIRFLPSMPKDFGHTEFTVLPQQTPKMENMRGIGPAEMADAILTGRKNRANKEMAYHVLEVLTAMLRGGEEGKFVDIVSTCERPEPMQKSSSRAIRCSC